MENSNQCANEYYFWTNTNTINYSLIQYGANKNTNIIWLMRNYSNIFDYHQLFEYSNIFKFCVNLYLIQYPYQELFQKLTHPPSVRIFQHFQLRKQLKECKCLSINQSIRPSVRPSVCHTYLFVQFTSIFYNSKSD